VFYGHKATCWREWPASGSQWRDVHCGPPIVPAHMPQEAEMMPGPPVAEPMPAQGQSRNPFRDEASQASPSAETQAPNSNASGAMEPNTLPAAPGNGPVGEPVVPPQDVAPEQPMPHTPMPGDGFEPMSSDSGGSQLEYQSWSATTEDDQAPAQLQMNTIESSMPRIVAPEPARVVGNLPPRPADAGSIPITETGSGWRLVIQDNPDGISADGQVNAPLFKPPSFRGAHVPTAQAQRTAPPMRSLEEQTGDALERFMSFDTSPGRTR
jgi:hypothetical protein